MINILKKENLSAAILQTDFDVYKDVVNIFLNHDEKENMISLLDDNIIPLFFENKLTMIIKEKEKLVGCAIFKIIKDLDVSKILIENISVLNNCEDRLYDSLLIELCIYTTYLLGIRNININLDINDVKLYDLCIKFGFYKIDMDDRKITLNINLTSYKELNTLLKKYDSKPSDYIDYKMLKISNEISNGKNSNIYLTNDNRILKMFKSNSFVFIKDMEEKLVDLKVLDIDEVIKPKNLVYYNDVFVGYIMDYIPNGKSLWQAFDEYELEEKIDKIKLVEDLIKKLHEKDIYISNINLDNIYLTDDGKIKLISSDELITKKNVINDKVVQKYKDPYNKIISKQTDLYTFAIIILEILLNKKFDDDLDSLEVEKEYNLNKKKIPAGFKEFFENIFSNRKRQYLSESYEQYVNNIYNSNEIRHDLHENKSGNITIVFLALLMLIITIIGYFVFKKMR